MRTIGWYMGVRVETLTDTNPTRLGDEPDETSVGNGTCYGNLSRFGDLIHLLAPEVDQWYRAPSIKKAEQVMRQHRRCANPLDLDDLLILRAAAGQAYVAEQVVDAWTPTSNLRQYGLNADGTPHWSAR